MKAVMMAIRMLTNAFGNVIDVVVISLLKDVFDSQVQFFFLFAGMMLLDMILLAWMATRYTYKDYTTLVREDPDEKSEKEKGEDN
jgi:Na+/melibiose symporter-like transporter